MELFIRNVSPQTVDKIDEIAAAEELSRNALLLKIINTYVNCRDNFIVNSLPVIVQSMVENQLKRLEIGANSVENNVYVATKKLTETVQKIDNLLLPEIEKQAGNELKNEDIIKALNFLDTDNS